MLIEHVGGNALALPPSLAAPRYSLLDYGVWLGDI
jgi:hypothetical protein